MTRSTFWLGGSDLGFEARPACIRAYQPEDDAGCACSVDLIPIRVVTCGKCSVVHAAASDTAPSSVAFPRFACNCRTVFLTRFGFPPLTCVAFRALLGYRGTHHCSVLHPATLAIPFCRAPPRAGCRFHSDSLWCRPVRMVSCLHTLCRTFAYCICCVSTSAKESKCVFLHGQILIVFRVVELFAGLWFLKRGFVALPASHSCPALCRATR